DRIFPVLIADARLTYQDVCVFVKKAENAGRGLAFVAINECYWYAALIVDRESAYIVFRSYAREINEHTLTFDDCTPPPKSRRNSLPTDLLIYGRRNPGTLSICSLFWINYLGIIGESWCLKQVGMRLSNLCKHFDLQIDDIERGQ